MRRACLALFATLALTGCDDTIFGGKEEGGGDDSGGAAEGWCAVEAIFAADCTSCHGSGSTSYVDLETDAYNAIVNQPAIMYPDKTLVVPGDPDASFLYLKVTGAQGGDGGVMPPSGALGAADAEVIRAWIADGATEDCGSGGDSGGGGDDTGSPSSTHPEGYDAASVHGLEAKQQAQDCTSCHGADLNGQGDAVSCDTCHASVTADWKTDCTFCHGSAESPDPWEDIDDSTDLASLSFSAHAAHLTDSSTKLAFDCEQCHDVPTDVFTAGHLFTDDTTLGVAEVAFAGGISSEGAYNGGGSCSNLWCHGNGTDHNGEATVTDEFESCDSCHPSIDSTGAEVAVLGGKHQVHMEYDDGGDYLDCADCHRGTSADFEVIEHPEVHVNGEVAVQLVSMVEWDADEQTCEGECHGEVHAESPARDWYEPWYGYAL